MHIFFLTQSHMNIENFIGIFHEEMFSTASIRTSSPEISISIM